MIEFLRDVDVLILDSQYDSAEYKKHIGWGHGCVDDSVAIALQPGSNNFVCFTMTLTMTTRKSTTWSVTRAGSWPGRIQN